MESDGLQFNAHGRVTAVAQEAPCGAVLLVGQADRAALERSAASGRACFTVDGAVVERKELRVVEIRADLEGRAVLYLVKSESPVGTSESPSRFTRTLFGSADVPGPELLAEIETVLKGRMDSTDPHSYTAKLLKGDPGKIRAKVTEEAGEVVEASIKWDVVNLAEEVADVYFHCLLLCVRHGIGLSDVLGELAKRRGKRRDAPPPRETTLP